MKKTFIEIFDLIFPRRENDAAIAGISPADFYAAEARWQGEAYPSVRAVFHYRRPTVKAMIKELKSSKNRHAARIAGFALYEHLVENGIAQAVIVPMPISKKRRRKRGYNQCELVAEMLVRESEERKKRTGGIGPAFEIRTDILERRVDRPKSAFLDRAGRLEAAQGIFRATCTLHETQGRIIVIDDVVTTGSTMAEALLTLRTAGARNIAGVGIAH